MTYIEALIKLSEGDYSGILGMDRPIALIDYKSREFIGLSAKSEKFNGWRPQQLNGVNVYDVTAYECYKDQDRLWQDLNRYGFGSLKKYNYDSKGKPVILNVNCSLIDTPDKQIVLSRLVTPASNENRSIVKAGVGSATTANSILVSRDNNLSLNRR